MHGGRGCLRSPSFSTASTSGSHSGCAPRCRCGVLGFAAMLPTSLGLLLLVPNAAALVGFVALQVQTGAVEEPYLLATHRDAYAAYAARVGRFVPGIKRFN